MVEDSPEYERCKFCNSSFSDEILDKIKADKDDVYCEICGDIVKRVQRNYNSTSPYGAEIEPKPNIEITPVKPQKKIKQHPDALKFPIGRIFYDDEFSSTFKSNFVLVFSRVVCFAIMRFDQEGEIALGEPDIPENSLNDLYMATRRIQEKPVKEEFLRDLRNISKEDFKRYLKKLQDKIQDNRQYLEDFHVYTRWLIRKVYLIVSSGGKEEAELSKLDRTLYKELENQILYVNEPSNIQLDSTIDSTLQNPQYEIQEGPVENINQIINEVNQLSIESGLFGQFLLYTHENKFIKEFVVEFNKNRNWIKNLRPTMTFINFLKEKIDLVKNKTQAEILSNYLSLIVEIKKKDALTKAIKNMFLNDPGKYNAYDIQGWLLISDVAALNQLKKMFTEKEYQMYIRTQKHISINTLKKIAKKKGGKCHTKQIKTHKSRIELECAEGHKWTTSYDSVVYQDTWCPECNIYRSEEVCRQFFERIFKRPFSKSYPPWLLNEKGNQMELDGYNKELRLAFEYQGEHHRKKAFGLSEKDVMKRQEEDAYKLKICNENGVILLQIPDLELLPYDKMQNFIIKTYEKMSGKSLGKIPKYNWRKFSIYENEPAKKFRTYVEEKGGTLLTPYFTAKTEVTILCERGHEWTTTPDSVYKNNWCSVCAGNKKGTTEQYREIGEKFQCELINEYINAKTPLQYKCQKGHVFAKDPYWLNKDSGKIRILCPECKKQIYAQKFHNFVKNKGGMVLTPYKGRFASIKIQCEKNHKWNTTPGAVYQGNWCKVCAKENDPNKKRKEAAEQEFLKMLHARKYSLLSTYDNNTKLVQIKCKSNHTFTITPKYFKRLVNQKIEPCRKCRND